MLFGLYHPPQGDQLWKADIPWMPIPVHTEPKSQDFVSKALPDLGVLPAREPRRT